MTRRRLVIVGGVSAAVMGLLFAVGLVHFVVDGEYESAAGLVCMTALSLGVAVASVRYGSPRVTPRVTVTGSGTTFRPDRLVDVPMAVAYLGVLGNFWGTLLGSPYDLWPAYVPSWLSNGLVLVGGVVLTVVLVILLWGHLRWGASKYLYLSRDGVEMGQGLKPRSCRWDQVLSVTDRHPRGRSATPSAVVLRVDGEKAMYMTTSTFTPGGWELRRLVEFYWQYPEARGELVDGVAAHRLEQSTATR